MTPAPANVTLPAQVHAHTDLDIESQKVVLKAGWWVPCTYQSWFGWSGMLYVRFDCVSTEWGTCKSMDILTRHAYMLFMNGSTIFRNLLL